MALNTSLSNIVVFNAGITDTAAHNATAVNMDYMSTSTLIAQSTLDQAVVLSTQYSDDLGATWTNIGNTFSLATGTSLVTTKYFGDLTGLRIMGGMLRLVATAGVAPTTGILKLTMQGMDC